jgi:hypothetical protein
VLVIEQHARRDRRDVALVDRRRLGRTIATSRPDAARRRSIST